MIAAVGALIVGNRDQNSTLEGLVGGSGESLTSIPSPL